MEPGWELRTSVDDKLKDELTEQLVEYNKSRSEIVRARFEPANLKAEPVHAYALDTNGTVIGGCTASIERLWHWLTVDLLWVDPNFQGKGVGSSLLHSVEAEARQRDCQWAEVTTFDFQAPAFYVKAGYTEYGIKQNYPPGHSYHLLRKDL
jgi:GNAT superfamily N-acetyltransferase